MIAIRGTTSRTLNTSGRSWATSPAAPGIGEIADRANKRRPRWHRLPYGVPLCIGFLGYLVWIFEICPTPTTPDTHASQTDIPVQAARP